jgi:S-adenosylmethionine/arginine decarboxylase-like enzyme
MYYCNQCDEKVLGLFDVYITCEKCLGKIKQLEAKIKQLQKLYNELIMAIERKYPNESRHDTALRYIIERERQEAIEGIEKRTRYSLDKLLGDINENNIHKEIKLQQLKKKKKERNMYGKELILDLCDCNPDTFTRDSIARYLVNLCNLIEMERADLYWWDYEGYPEEYKKAPGHLKGTSCVQFIMTSTIVIHTLDELKKIFINIFACKDFDESATKNLTESWFEGKSINVTLVERK